MNINAVDYDAFRAAFRTALGDDRYRKFIATGVRPRLRFWQEVELRAFFDAQPSLRLEGAQLEEALRICEIHDLPLRFESVDVFPGCMDYTAEYMQIRRELFPRAAADPVSSEGRKDMPSVIDVAYCPECRRVRSAWLQEQEIDLTQTKPATS